MSHKQTPLATGFDAASTAQDVIAGIALAGKNVIVTGGNAGIGLEVVRALSKAGASVTVASRNPTTDDLRGLENVETGRLDLSDPDSIKAFSAKWLSTGRPLHILINNAGVPAPQERKTDGRGYELQFSTNYLGHFQLTQCLMPALRAANGARVVNVSSGAQRFGNIRWDDVNFESGYDANTAYAQSKLAMVLFSVELDRRFSSNKIRAYSVHPGVIVGTKLNSSAGQDALRAMGLIDATGSPIINPGWGTKTPAQGASSIVFAATSSFLAGIGGVYIKDNDISALDDEPKPITAESIPSDIMSHAVDPQSARRLWDMSEHLLDVTAASQS